MSISTSKYARALADVVLGRNADPGVVVQELESLQGTLEASPELGAVWESPSVPAAQKLGLLDAIVKQAELSPVARNFTAVLIEHGLLPALPEITLQFKTEANERRGVAEAEIIASRPLSDQEKHSLEQKIAATAGKTIQARYVVDEKILGGIIVKIGSTIYDGSVRGELGRLKQILSAG